MDQITINSVLIYLAVMNILGFILMGMDKQKAIKKEWRIPEKTLILIAFLGGGIGTFLGMYVFRHKTKHMKFVLLLPCAAALDVIIVLIVYHII